VYWLKARKIYGTASRKSFCAKYIVKNRYLWYAGISSLATRSMGKMRSTGARMVENSEREKGRERS